MAADRKNATTPLVRMGLQEQLLRRLGLRILRRDLEPGDVLPPEEALAAEFGVSRNVVREAIKALAAKGLVKGRPRTGTQVLPRAQWNLLDDDVLDWQYELEHDPGFLRNVCELRRAIEPLAARLAAARASAADLAELGASYARMTETADADDAYIEADLRFHTALLAASGNELLEQVGRTFKFALRASRHVTVSAPGANRAALPLHERVLQAVRAGDGDAAESSMRELVERASTDIARLLEPTHDAAA
jgi:GntR family galactonate operon transcriptional repressor